MLNLTRCCGLLFASSLVLPTVSQWVRNNFNNTHMFGWIGLLSQQMSGVSSFSPHGVFRIRISIGHLNAASKSSVFFGMLASKFEGYQLIIFMSSGGYWSKLLGFYPKKIALRSSLPLQKDSDLHLGQWQCRMRVGGFKSIKPWLGRNHVPNALQMWGA